MGTAASGRRTHQNSERCCLKGVGVAHAQQLRKCCLKTFWRRGSCPDCQNQSFWCHFRLFQAKDGQAAKINRSGIIFDHFGPRPPRLPESTVLASFATISGQNPSQAKPSQSAGLSQAELSQADPRRAQPSRLESSRAQAKPGRAAISGQSPSQAKPSRRPEPS